MIGSTAYLVLVILTFVENYREWKAHSEETSAEMKRPNKQLKESEHARKEA